jgi:hypothetical protein
VSTSEVTLLLFKKITSKASAIVAFAFQNLKTKLAKTAPKIERSEIQNSLSESENIGQFSKRFLKIFGLLRF